MTHGEYLRATFPELFQANPGEFDVRADNGRTYRIHAESPGSACERVADMHGVSIVAWRTPRAMLAVGVDPRQVIG